MPDSPAWTEWLAAYERLPAYFDSNCPLFALPPDLLVVHSAAVGDWPAEWLHNPVVADGADGAIHCKDGCWRAAGAAHVSWFAGETVRVRPGFGVPYKGRAGWVQQVSLHRGAWGVSGRGICQGRGKVNARSIHVELPGPASAHIRPEWHRQAFRELLGHLLPAVPSLRYVTTHAAIQRGKTDPGPGWAFSPWCDGTGLQWVGRD